MNLKSGPDAARLRGMYWTTSRASADGAAEQQALGRRQRQVGPRRSLATPARSTSAGDAVMLRSDYAVRISKALAGRIEADVPKTKT